MIVVPIGFHAGLVLSWSPLTSLLIQQLVFGRKLQGSLITMKPIQVHRILKEKVVSESNDSKSHGLIPLLSYGKEFNLPHRLPTYQNNTPLLPRIEVINDKEQSSLLNKRVKELEKDNFKLNHHVQQAEETIRNYRALMTKYNINPNESPRLESIPVTLPQSDIPPIKMNISDDAKIAHDLQCQLSALTSQLQDAKERACSYEEENKSLVVSLNDYKNKACRIDELISRNETLQQGVRIRERRTLELEQDVFGLKQASQSSRQKMLNQLQDSLHCVQRLHQDFSTLRESAEVDLFYMQKYVQTKLTTIQQSIQHMKHSYTQESIQDKKEILRLQLLCSNMLSAHSNAQPMHSNVPSAHSNKIANSPSLQPKDSPSKTSHAEHIERLTSQIASHLQQVERYKAQLTQVSNTVTDLHSIHAAEIKAIKHLTHIKELKRVAKEREDVLDKDRLAIEIKFLK